MPGLIADPWIFAGCLVLLLVPRNYLRQRPWKRNRANKGKAGAERRLVFRERSYEDSGLPSDSEVQLGPALLSLGGWVDLARAWTGTWALVSQGINPDWMGADPLRPWAIFAGTLVFAWIALSVQMLRRTEGELRLAIPGFYLVGFGLGLIQSWEDLRWVLLFVPLGLLACKPLIQGPTAFLFLYTLIYGAIGFLFFRLGNGYAVLLNTGFALWPVALNLLAGFELYFERKQRRTVRRG